MRELSLNGYIDDDLWCGDEITPETLHGSLYGENNDQSDDVHIRLNSYGGSCNAAVRMYDDIRAYPGSVSITISGTAASAATILCMAADHLEITPGSLFMIHDPGMMAFGNEHDLAACIDQLRACKESILNMYERRVRLSRNDTAAMMTASTWMDANIAFESGFVDAIAEDPVKYPVNDADGHTMSREKAQEAVDAWLERKNSVLHPVAVSVHEPVNEPEIIEEEPASEPEKEQVPVAGPERVKINDIDLHLENLKY